MIENHQNHSPATVYGRPGCYQCKLTMKVMDNEGIPYQYRDVDSDSTIEAEAKAVQAKHGLSFNLPIVVGNSTPWAGFSPDRIRGLKSE